MESSTREETTVRSAFSRNAARVVAIVVVAAPLAAFVGTGGWH
jgi:hypothetical protein